MNLPNKLTVLRVLMVPFFVLFMLTDLGGVANKWIALAIFVVASLTDLWMEKLPENIIWSQILESLWIRLRINCWYVQQ